MSAPPSPWNILVAADYTDAARYGLRAAARLAGRLEAKVAVLTVVPNADGSPGGSDTRGTQQDTDRLRRWATPELAGVVATFVVGFGLPGIEICRFAEESEADLVILVRKQRSQMSRVISGDTVDSVVRRSVVPCLLVPPEDIPIGAGLVAALDGTDRGVVVFRRAARFAEATHQELVPLTIEPRRANEPAALAAEVPTGRSLQLADAVQSIGGTTAEAPLVIRRGIVVDQVLSEMEQRAGSVLAVGYRRGGPPGVIEAGSIGRQLIHKFRGPVLTVPL